MNISDADKTYLQGLLKDPSIGSRGAKAIFEAVKAQGRAYNAKTKTGLTNKDITEWYNNLTTIQIHKKINGYNSFNPEYPLQQFQIDLIMMKKAWHNEGNKYALVCIDIFTKKADMVPMKNKEADTVNQAMKKILKNLGTPESIYCDEGSEFTNNKFLQLLDDDKIKILYATNHAPFVESFNRTMKRMIYKYMEHNGITSWTDIIKSLLHAYNTTVHSTTKMKPNDIHVKDIELVRKNIASKALKVNYPEINEGDDVLLAMKEKTFRKESDPNFDDQVYKVEKNLHNGVYKVGNTLHSRKDLLKVVGPRIAPPKPVNTKALKEADKIGKAQYSPNVTQIAGKLNTNQVAAMISTPRSTRGKQVNFRQLAGLKP